MSLHALLALRRLKKACEVVWDRGIMAPKYIKDRPCGHRQMNAGFRYEGEQGNGAYQFFAR